MAVQPAERSGARDREKLDVIKTDFLDYVLSFLRVTSSAAYVFDLKAPWGIEATEIPWPISLTVVEGGMWMSAPEVAPLRLERGDTLLLPRGISGERYALTSSPEVVPHDVGILFKRALASRSFPRVLHDRPVFLSGGGEGEATRVISAAFGFSLDQLGPLVEALPEIMVVYASEMDAALIDALLRHLVSGNDGRPGYPALLAHTAQLLLVQVVRAYALADRGRTIGWLAALDDPRLVRALVSIHNEPEREWSVATLAKQAGLSRSGFAARFSERIGRTPMQYLRDWRMQLARHAIAHTDVTITALSQNLGYQSEAAFRGAFRLSTGLTPREFRRKSLSERRR